MMPAWVTSLLDRMIGRLPTGTPTDAEFLAYMKATGKRHEKATIATILALASAQAQTYAITLIAGANFNPVDAVTYLWGVDTAVPLTTSIARVYIPKAGTITHATIRMYAATVGTNEDISVYLRLNGTTDTLIETLGAATNERVFNNEALSIAVAVGDYIEVKMVCPTWATNPAACKSNGVVVIETT